MERPVKKTGRNQQVRPKNWAARECEFFLWILLGVSGRWYSSPPSDAQFGNDFCWMLCSTVWWWRSSVGGMCLRSTVSISSCRPISSQKVEHSRLPRSRKRQERVHATQSIVSFRALSAGKDIYKVGRPCAQDSDCTAFSPAKCDSKSSLCERLH